MSTPRVSVVVATRDRSGSLGRLLESLRGQTLIAGEFEVIVVDDGSRDETKQLLGDERNRGGLALTVLSRGAGGGPSAVKAPNPLGLPESPPDPLGLYRNR